jgi:isopenicillin N synthase-like dioxygenase
MSKDCPSTPSIPLIDFSVFSNSDAGVDEQVSVANQLLEGFKKNGFVYLQKVSVSPEMVAEAFGWVRPLSTLEDPSLCHADYRYND